MLVMSKRILIADDSLTIQKAFAMTFAGEDVALLAARSADEGLNIARQARPELVIADAVMPGRSGYDLASAIKSDPNLRGVPVYILASAQNPYDESRGRQSGADGSFVKPFESAALIERVREAIAKGSTTAATAGRPPLTSVPVGAAPAAAARGTGPARSIDLDDDYGEITIDSATRATDVTPVPREPMSMPSRPAAAPAPAAPAGLRPSLIPGLRPGAAPPPSRPGMTVAPRPASAPAQQAPSLFPPVGHATSPVNPASHHATPGAAGAPGSGVRPPLPQTATATPAPSRTLIGLPATLPQAPQRLGVPTAPARPPTQPVRPLENRTPPPAAVGGTPAGAPPGMIPPGLGARPVAENPVDQKIAQISARGPEYEAIAKLSREIIERIVWEVVPELAEVIVREELQKRGRI